MKACKRLYKLSKMAITTQCYTVHFPSLSHVIYKRSNFTQNSCFPCTSFVQVRVFASSRLTSTTHNPKIESTESQASLFNTLSSRTIRAEAQIVLFEYLHFTRGLSFTDAEHISKNSPHFLQNLISSVIDDHDCDVDVSRALCKFLRYNPINEFESFFESIGLSPAEVSSLVPSRLIFLSDDNLLIENFHVLCDFGIPRVRIGKMYKEVREIFSHDFGLLESKLKAYENLGLSKSTVIKLVSCSPSLLVGSVVDNDFACFIAKLKRLGIESDCIGEYMFQRYSYNWKRMLDTMDFLGRAGHSEEQLYNLFRTNPLLVIEGSGKRIYVLFGRLLKLGISVKEVRLLFVNNPQILLPMCEKKFLRALDIMLSIELEMEDIADIVCKHMKLLCLSSLKGPKTIYKELNIEKNSLPQFIREDPIKFFSLASKSNIKSSEWILSENPSKKQEKIAFAEDPSKSTEKMALVDDPIRKQEKIAFLLRLGYVENSDEMMKALKKFRGRGDQLQERYDCLVQAGLDYNVVSSLIKHAPMILNQSKDVIEKKIDCLTRCLGYPLTSVVAFPTYLCYDIERINHRFRMYAWLREKGAAKPTLSLSTILASSDARFRKHFVNIHPEGPAMWESLRNVSSSS